MKALRGTSVSLCTKVHVPIQLAWQALCRSLEDLEAHPGAASLRVALPGPFDACLSVPIKAAVSEGNSRYELEIEIKSATRKDLFPHFRGVIWLVHTLADTCDLRLEGNYRVPFAGIGKTVDMTFSRDAARASLKRFVEQLAENISDRMRVVS